MIQFVLFRLILSLGRLPVCSPALRGEGKAEGLGEGGERDKNGNELGHGAINWFTKRHYDPISLTPFPSSFDGGGRM